MYYIKEAAAGYVPDWTGASSGGSRIVEAVEQLWDVVLLQNEFKFLLKR